MTAMEWNASIGMRPRMLSSSPARPKRCFEFCQSLEHLIEKALHSFWPLVARWGSGLYFEALSCFPKHRCGRLKTEGVKRENIFPRKPGSLNPSFPPRPSWPSFKKHSNEFYLAILNRNRELVSL